MGILEEYKYLKTLSMPTLRTIVLNSCCKICNSYKYDTIFVTNRTRHASHLNSAPRRVFDFYGGLVL